MKSQRSWVGIFKDLTRAMVELGCTAKEFSKTINEFIKYINEHPEDFSDNGPETGDTTDTPNQNSDLEIFEQIVISEEFQNLIDLL